MESDAHHADFAFSFKEDDMNNMNTTDYAPNLGRPGQWRPDGSIGGTQVLRVQENQRPDIKEPSVYAKADETLNYISEALDSAVKISCRVAGDSCPESPENNAKQSGMSLDCLLGVSAQRAAYLVSILRTISAKIG